MNVSSGLGGWGGGKELPQPSTAALKTLRVSLKTACSRSLLYSLVRDLWSGGRGKGRVKMNVSSGSEDKELPQPSTAALKTLRVSAETACSGSLVYSVMAEEKEE